jgi:hypothetical protein
VSQQGEAPSNPWKKPVLGGNPQTCRILATASLINRFEALLRFTKERIGQTLALPYSPRPFC